MRKRIQQRSYIQEQYVLTHCSLSSEQSLQTHSHIHASTNSDSAGGVFLPDPHSSGSVLDTGSLPQGLEKMPPPEQRLSLSRWADTAWSQNLSGETDSSADKVSYSDRNQLTASYCGPSSRYCILYHQGITGQNKSRGPVLVLSGSWNRFWHLNFEVFYVLRISRIQADRSISTETKSSKHQT